MLWSLSCWQTHVRVTSIIAEKLSEISMPFPGVELLSLHYVHTRREQGNGKLYIRRKGNGILLFARHCRISVVELATVRVMTKIKATIALTSKG